MGGKHYYNDVDPMACQWIRELIRDGLIPDGDVDERSICEVQADEIRGYTQTHFFAGISGWPRALQLAGVSPTRPVWTGSCPCPPFSSAGKKQACPACGGRPVPCPRRTGYFICLECEHAWLADARHLWPEFWRLIRDVRPPTVFGEQVAGPDGLLWLAGVRSSLERIGYGVGAADLPACAVGAPHIRHRLFWVAHALHPQRRAERDADGGGARGRDEGSRIDAEGGGLADTECSGVWGNGRGEAEGAAGGVQGADRERQRVRPDPGSGRRGARSRFAFGPESSESVERLREQGRLSPECERYLADTGGMADVSGAGCRRRAGGTCGRDEDEPERLLPAGGLGHPIGTGPQGCGASIRGGSVDRACGESPGEPGDSRGLGDSHGESRAQRDGESQGGVEASHGSDSTRSGVGTGRVDDSASERTIDAGKAESCRNGAHDGVPGTAGSWSDYDIILCGDGKYRRIPKGSLESCVQPVAARLPSGVAGGGLPCGHQYPLAEAYPGRVGLLRGVGNAIVAEVAAVFIRAFLESADDL